MTDRGFFGFLGSALDALAEEVPAASTALARTLRGIELKLHVDGEARALLAHADRCALSRDALGCVAELRTERKVLISLLAAEQTLLHAVITDALLLRGAPAHVISVHEALVVFVQGAVRSISIPELLDEYLHGGRDCD